MTEVTTLTTKLGTAKGVARSRIWIEGQRLKDAGFVAKASYFFKDWQEDHHVLTLTKVGPNDVMTDMPSKVSGKGDHPIIDITGKKVAEFFGAKFSHVEVTYGDGIITIRGADNG